MSISSLARHIIGNADGLTYYSKLYHGDVVIQPGSTVLVCGVPAKEIDREQLDDDDLAAPDYDNRHLPARVHHIMRQDGHGKAFQLRLQYLVSGPCIG